MGHLASKSLSMNHAMANGTHNTIAACVRTNALLGRSARAGHNGGEMSSRMQVNDIHKHVQATKAKNATTKIMFSV